MLLQLGALPGFEKIFWFFALVGTIIFLIQALLVLVIGSDHSIHIGEHDTHGAHEHEGGLNLFTVRNMVVFFMMFGWFGIASVHGHQLTALRMTVATVLAFFGGTAMMVLVALMFLAMKRLTSSGNFELKQTIGCLGKVYIPINQTANDTGKIIITLNNRTVEAKAQSKAVAIGLNYQVGEAVEVVDVVGDVCLIKKA